MRREKIFRHKELENKWVLNQVRGLNSSFWLTVPLDADFILIKNTLKNLPGGSSEFIIADAFESKEIYFRCTLPFKKCFFTLIELLGLTYTGNYNSLPYCPDRAKKKVRQYTLDGQLVNEWNSMTDIKDALGYNISIISKAARKIYYVKKQFTDIAYGYRWELLKKEKK